MKRIALLGAGGKMGVRLSRNLQKTDYSVDHVEISAEGRTRLKDATGLDCVDLDTAVGQADAVILAVPDRMIGSVSAQIIDQVKSGGALIVLDAAAPHAGKMPNRSDVTIFVTHPCHPSLFELDAGPEARRDFFGGVDAVQHIVCALMRGPEEHYAPCEAIARAIYAPVDRSHRCSVEHLAILEPALSETVGATLALAMRDAVNEAVRRGVPEQAATDFMLGHLNIELAIAFGIFPEGQFSDGALLAIEKARPLIFREGWLDRIFEPEAVRTSVKEICDPQEAA